ncbi:MAG: helix-turn-helix transcriptional regulator [Treponema sp.]|nr:helix-turn-helix transcriptional regulator [Treponema sp.]
MLDFWLRVKDKLDFQDSTQRDLAQNINESYNTLQSWINRDRLPNAEQAVKIAEALNTSVEFLVTGKSSNKKNDHSKTVKLLEQAIVNLQKEMQ